MCRVGGRPHGRGTTHIQQHTPLRPLFVFVGSQSRQGPACCLPAPVLMNCPEMTALSELRRFFFFWGVPCCHSEPHCRASGCLVLVLAPVLPVMPSDKGPYLSAMQEQGPEPHSLPLPLAYHKAPFRPSSKVARHRRQETGTTAPQETKS